MIMQAYNKRFGEIGAEVIAQAEVIWKTISVNPNCVQSSPNFAKPPGRYRQPSECDDTNCTINNYQLKIKKLWTTLFQTKKD